MNPKKKEKLEVILDEIKDIQRKLKQKLSELEDAIHGRDVTASDESSNPPHGPATPP